MKLEIRNGRLSLLRLLGLSVFLAALLSGIHGHSPLANLDDLLLDLALGGESPPSEGVALLLVDEESLAAYGPWPLDRAIWGRVVDELARGDARWIAFDVIFSEGSHGGREEGDRAFAASLRRFPRCVLPHYWRPRRVLRPETGRLEKVWTREDPAPIFPRALGGFANVSTSEGPTSGLLRSVTMERVFGRGGTDRSFVWNLARAVDGRRTSRVDPSKPFFPRWVAGRKRFPAFSLKDLLEGKVPGERISGRVIFVGASSPSLQDVKATPLGPLPGVWVQAHLFDGLVDCGPMKGLPLIGLFLLVFSMLLLGGFLNGASKGTKLALLLFLLFALSLLSFASLRVFALRWSPSILFLGAALGLFLPRPFLVGGKPKVGALVTCLRSGDGERQSISSALLALETAGREGERLRLALVHGLARRGEQRFARTLASELTGRDLDLDELEETALLLARSGIVDQARRLLHELCRRDIEREEARRVLCELEEELAASAGLVTLEGMKEILGRDYDEVELRGEGASALVFRARRRSEDRPVALKVYRPWLMRREEQLRRFRRERRVLQHFDCPVFPRLVDHGEGKLAVLVMDWVDGESLHLRLRRGALPLDEAISLGRSLLEGLARLHEEGCLHGDVKAENVIVGPEGPRLVDFGLAGFLDEEEEGLFLGTPGAMAPECRLGLRRGTAVDVFAFGVLVGKMLVGEVDGGRGFDMGVAFDRIEDPELKVAFSRCLASDPEDRPRAEELLALLGRGRSHSATLVRR